MQILCALTGLDLTRLDYHDFKKCCFFIVKVSKSKVKRLYIIYYIFLKYSILLYFIGTVYYCIVVVD